jgi:hypothetical protein
MLKRNQSERLGRIVSNKPAGKELGKTQGKALEKGKEELMSLYQQACSRQQLVRAVLKDVNLTQIKKNHRPDKGKDRDQDRDRDWEVPAEA